MRIFKEVPVDREQRGGRWWLLKKTIGAKHPQGPMLTRYMLIQLERLGIYVHHWHRPDADREHHIHPWRFTTLVLRGGYTETVLPCPSDRVPIRWERTWRPLSLHRMPLRYAHRVTCVLPGTVSLLVVGRKAQLWGFWEHGPDGPNFIPWQMHQGATADPMDS